jgi:hypothetical protein
MFMYAFGFSGGHVCPPKQATKNWKVDEPTAPVAKRFVGTTPAPDPRALHPVAFAQCSTAV